MGLFDKFRKKVREAASEVDSDSLSAEEGSDEALEALSHQEQLNHSEAQSKEILAGRTHVPAHNTQPDFEDEEWEEEEGLPLIIGKVNMGDEELKSWDEKFLEVTGASEHQAAIAHYGAENEDSYNQIRIISGEISGEIIKILKDEMEGDEYFYL